MVQDITLLDVVELYVIELIVFTGGAYLLYRLLVRTVPAPDDEPADEASERR